MKQNFKPALRCCLAFVLIAISCSSENTLEHKAYPNIIYILADDMGYGDVSAFNPQSKIKTPHLDALAAAGMKFTDAHSGSSVCTPTRYGILTGRYAWRTKIKQGVTWSYDLPLIPNSHTTVASLLKQQGYNTAAIGKWHLGLGWQRDQDGKVDIRLPLTAGPTTIGFDTFFGIAASLDIPPYIYIENDRSTTTKIDTIAARDGMGFWRRGPLGDDFQHEQVLPVLTERAVHYIKSQKSQKSPFFLYFPLPAPHTPILPTEKFKGKSGTNAYGDFVQMVDDVVGQIQTALKASGKAENTLLIFTTDNGCSPMADFKQLASMGHHPGYVYRGHKADIYEGGHRVPFIASWPKRIKPGSRSDETVCLNDLMATVAEITQTELADNEGEDSISMLPIFLGQKYEVLRRQAIIHHSINGSFAIRQNEWKLAFCPGSGGWSDPKPGSPEAAALPRVQLYNLHQDPGESINLAAEHPGRVQNLTNLMQKIISDGRSTAGPKQMNDTETRLYLSSSK